MLEIVRGRNWAVAHTVLDNEEGPPTDLSIFETIESQIREKTATKNAKGFFEHKKVADVTVVIDESVMWLTLEKSDIDLLQTGDYLIDVVGTLEDGSHESLLDPEPIKVVNRPTQPSVTAPVFALPNFVELLETALED